eukprot:1114851-Amphidinium_carterae.3
MLLSGTRLPWTGASSRSIAVDVLAQQRGPSCLRRRALLSHSMVHAVPQAHFAFTTYRAPADLVLKGACVLPRKAKNGTIGFDRIAIMLYGGLGGKLTRSAGRVFSDGYNLGLGLGDGYNLGLGLKDGGTKRVFRSSGGP